MRYIHSLIMVCVAVCLTSCGKFGSGTPAVSIRTLLPGECLASTELSYYIPNSSGQQVDGNSFIFGFTMDLSGHSKERIDDKVFALKWRDVPSDEIFDTFGANKQAVKNEFERIFEEFTESYGARFHHQWYSIVTLLYDGGISLIANRDFAGCPAGENLASLITYCPMYDNLVKESGENPVIAPGFNTPSNAGGFLGIPMNYISMTDDGVGFSIPMGEHKLIEEAVTFELNIPVKVVLYLTWLNNKLTDPNAPVPYEDEVLHCTFTTKYGLK